MDTKTQVVITRKTGLDVMLSDILDNMNIIDKQLELDKFEQQTRNLFETYLAKTLIKSKDSS